MDNKNKLKRKLEQVKHNINKPKRQRLLFKKNLHIHYWILICQFCDARTLVQISNTNKKYHELIKQNKILKKWQPDELEEMLICKNNLLLFHFLQTYGDSYTIEEKQELFESACFYGHKKLAKYFLKQEPMEIDPTWKENVAIQFACQNGYSSIVRLLLKFPKVNPTTDGNFCIIMACQNGHHKVLKLLLKHELVDPTCDNNFPIQVACMSGHVKIVKILLKDGRADPTADDLIALKFSIDERHYKIAKILLNDPRVEQHDIT